MSNRAFVEDAKYITETTLTAPLDGAPEVTVAFDHDGGGEVTISDQDCDEAIIVDAEHLELLHDMLGRAIELRNASILDPAAAGS
ncbi:hypothetical protein [Agromyces subbeticus]|uniref:hypothetical protein n=1 Tax=Agromyces subbeticus TaxID=293890 RepID=UPI0003B337D9|nr:hypothetical protein [Agromyces subbeticus]